MREGAVDSYLWTWEIYNFNNAGDVFRSGSRGGLEIYAF